MTSRGFAWFPILAAIAVVFGISGGTYWYMHTAEYSGEYSGLNECLVVGGCSAGNPPIQEGFSTQFKELSNKMSVLWDEIEAIVKVEATAVSQCKAVPIGKKGCGGPANYVVYSTQYTNEQLLNKKVEEYTNLALEREAIQRLPSDCSIVEVRNIRLESGKCVADIE